MNVFQLFFWSYLTEIPEYVHLIEETWRFGTLFFFTLSGQVTSQGGIRAQFNWLSSVTFLITVAHFSYGHSSTLHMPVYEITEEQDPVLGI